MNKRLWLDELHTYLTGATAVRSPAGQWSHCVVVSNDLLGDQSTFRDLVQNRRVYFHPKGSADGWPKPPPNFLTLRWQGYVQLVNWVAQYEVVADLVYRFLDIPRGTDDGARIVFDLGPDIPIPDVRTKSAYATARVQALLGQNLTAPPLMDAADRSKVIDPT